MAILSKACKPDHFESHNSLKLRFTNIRGLRSSFIDCESFLESSIPDILFLCETNLDDSTYSGKYPLIRKNSITHMHGIAVNLMENSLLHGTYIQKTADSYLCFRLVLLHSVSYFFFSIDHLFHLCTWFLIVFHLTQMRFSRSTHLLMFLSLGTLTFIITTG